MFINEVDQERKVGDGTVTRWGTGLMLMKETKVAVKDDSVTLTCTYQAEQDVPSPILGFTIFSPAGVNLLEGNTLKERIKVPDLKKDETYSLEWKIPNIFASGHYSVSVACCDQSTTEYYDWVNAAASFNVMRDRGTSGIVDPDLGVTKVG